MSFPYQIVTAWSENDGCYVARVPALLGCAAHGDTSEEATKEAEIAGTEIVRLMGKKAPAPDATSTDFSGNIRLRLPRFMHAELSRQATTEGVSLNQLMVALLAARAPVGPLGTPSFRKLAPENWAPPKSKPKAKSSKRASARK